MEFLLQLLNKIEGMKKPIKLLIFVFVMKLMTGCCLFKTELSEDDLGWVNVYNEGDTIIFKSSEGMMDTSWIVQKVVYYPECNPIAHHSKYKYHTARIFYQNSKLNYSSGGKQLISVVKYEDRTAVDIFYLNKGFMLDNEEWMNLFENIMDVKRIEAERVYLFSNYHPKSKPEDIEFLYWHDDYGIIKYITHSGIEWKRINLEWEVE
jgi:hypothetical protein